MARWLRYCVWLAVPLLVLGLIGKPIFRGLNGAQSGAYDVFRVLLVGLAQPPTESVGQHL